MQNNFVEELEEMTIMLNVTFMLSSQHTLLWRCGVVVITTLQHYSTKPELRFCAGSNPARGVQEIRDGEDLWQYS